MQNLEGQRIPEVEFVIREDDQFKKLSSRELFDGKTVIVFALPGAFTPTCSSTHLPRYNELAPIFKAQGVDSIICLSVNDPFVMNAWAEDQTCENLYLLPDGNGEFSEKMGMLVDKEELGFGKRSWRYSMLVNNGTIEKMFIEPQKPGDPFEVSDADTMLNYISPETQAPASISIITKPGCQFCATAKKLLDNHQLSYEEIVLGRDATTTSVRAITGKETAPQVFIAGQYIGGSEALAEYLGDTI